jgi:glycosyltransferase involved in cell wall biosynthesis
VNKPRILLAGDYPRGFCRGGVQAVMRATARALAVMGDLEVHVASPSPEHAQSQVRDDGGVQVHEVRVARAPASVRALTIDAAAVRQVIRAVEPHLVHAHSQEGHALAAVRCGRPAVVSVHGLLQAQNHILRGRHLWRKLRAGLWTRAERGVLRQARDVIVMSHYVAEAVERESDANLHWAPNPIGDEWCALRDDPAPGRVLFVGLITPRKDLETLVRAVLHMPGRTEVRIAGAVHDQKYFQDLLRLSKELSVDARVSFTGRLSDDALRREYRRAMVVVLPSLEESAPIAITQAMAAGKPVVATRVGGIPDLISDEQNGLLVPARNPEALGAAVGRILRNRGLRERLARDGRQRGLVHQPGQVARRLRAIYARVLEHQGIYLSLAEQRLALEVINSQAAPTRERAWYGASEAARESADGEESTAPLSPAERAVTGLGGDSQG